MKFILLRIADNMIFMTPEKQHQLCIVYVCDNLK